MKKLVLAAMLMSTAWAASVSAAEQNQMEQKPGLVNGVVESTDADHIAAIEERARQLEAKQVDNYEPPAAGKTSHKHKHRHGGKHHKMMTPEGNTSGNSSNMPAQ